MQNLGNDLFINLTRPKLLNINVHQMIELTFHKGQIIYDIGDSSDFFYIIRFGNIIHDTTL